MSTTNGPTATSETTTSRGPSDVADVGDIGGIDDVGDAGQAGGSGGSTAESGGPAAKIVRAVRLLRIGAWTALALFVVALLAVTVVGPFLLGNPAVTGGRPRLFGGLLLSLVAGTAVFVVATLALD
ncbi:hypothetical protein SAMN04487949_3608 [Halogranum gelatinilyticum]|uniref:Uncharacterized protein n=1 Tax=Halogranum gelatinilyticum TaxID=660521 RepID=A0A1G9ZD27_9EURY|nr:hypothetical protein [Halogranum gelatinilyticum]SDN19144.1 hypothetical protein SAMN04487949_3608 [Halogranum gelatinilyticum]